MNLLVDTLQFVLHLDRNLPQLVTEFGPWIYAILFAVIFAETGLVVTPFLPGDSLIFLAGTLAAVGGGMDPVILFVVLLIAAILGNASNYWIGRWIGPRVFHWPHSRWFNRRALDEAHAFYEKYGGVTITMARFMPIVRTFAPFVAGVGAMSQGKFQFWSALGAILWVGGFILAGYLFGNLPFVQENLSAIMVGVVLISLAPMAIGLIRAKLARRS
ncbi:MAG: DedA family protein [Burkholderiaceae bacterium]